MVNSREYKAIKRTSYTKDYEGISDCSSMKRWYKSYTRENNAFWDVYYYLTTRVEKNISIREMSNENGTFYLEYETD